jgi:hypothetical protein
VHGAGRLQAEVNQIVSSPIAGSVFSTDGKIVVLSVLDLRPIGVEAESCSIPTLRILVRSVAQARPTRRVEWVVDLKRKD